ncbi:hypothetical protein BDN70DRAFT_269490 [Pholiota conissans]|uniref:Uncharacterized protein n=1 Tax=Pholiota conissans TaxID=109636 RepID=A0A9P6CVZ2_9AGAR|nr:hypothetical protein BDN70DRAFT_269490 [Pholiota conissans]
MASSSFRRVVIDDTDSLFQYGASWSVESSAARDATVNSGPAFDQTLHRTAANTSLTVNFSGSDFMVSSSVTPILVNDVVQKFPEWECIVDGNSLGVMSIDKGITQPQNNLGICSSVLGDGPHELVLKVTTNAISPFWIDAIQYTPSANADLSNTTFKVYNSDPNIQFSNNDFATGTYGVKLTQTTGATTTFNFVGKSLTWVGYIFAGYANVSSSATYSIDNAPSVSFALPTSGVSFGNSIFFKTPELSLGPHTLVVTHQGNNKTMPLVLDYFFVSNTTAATGAAPTTASTTSGTSTTGSSTTGIGSDTTGSSITSFRSHKNNTGAIIGGVIGSVAVILFAVLAFFLIKRRSGSGSKGPPMKEYRDYEQDGAN